MNITSEQQPECKVKLRVEIPAEEVESTRRQVINHYKKQAKIPGFRPGKVPTRIIEQRFADGIDYEIKDRLTQKGIREAIQKEDLSALSVALTEAPEIHPDQSLTFEAEVTTPPEFEIAEADYKGIAVQLPKLEVTEADIDASLEQMRERFSEFEDVEGRALAMGDLAVISYRASLDGTPLEEALPDAGAQISGNEDFWVKMDEESFLPGFCNGLVDANVGDKRDVEVVVEEDFPLEDLQGKELVYDVEIKGIKQQVLPDLDDAFAAKMGEDLTMESLREKIAEEMEAQQVQQREQAKENQVINFLANQIECELPADLVTDETQRRVDEIANNAVRQGVPEDELLGRQEEIIDSASQQARLNVKTSFILGKIAEQEELEPNDEEITNAVANLAEARGVPVKKFLREFNESDGYNRVHHNLVMQKAIQFLMENAEVTEVDPPTPEEA